jgi:thioredoxin reductase
MEYFAGEYEVIVIGAGHAGCEAALAAARMKCKTLLLTLNMENIALLPCNPYNLMSFFISISKPTRYTGSIKFLR